MLLCKLFVDQRQQNDLWSQITAYVGNHHLLSQQLTTGRPDPVSHIIISFLVHFKLSADSTLKSFLLFDHFKSCNNQHFCKLKNIYFAQYNIGFT